MTCRIATKIQHHWWKYHMVAYFGMQKEAIMACISLHPSQKYWRVKAKHCANLKHSTPDRLDIRWSNTQGATFSFLISWYPTATSWKSCFFFQKNESKYSQADLLFLKREKKYSVRPAQHTQMNPSHAGMNPSTSEYLGVVKRSKKWTQVTPSETKWTLVMPSQVKPCEPEWRQVKPSETEWCQVHPSEPKWHQVQPSDAKCT